MRILLYGDCDLYGSGAWCYYENLKDMGHVVDYYSQFKHVTFYSSSLMYRVIRRLNNGAMLEHHRLKHVKGFEDKADEFKPDLIIVFKGILVDKKTVRNLRNRGIWIALVNHDDFFSQFKRNTSKVQWESVPEYSYIFCTREVNVKELYPYNPNVEMFLFSYYPKIHFPPEDISEEDKQTWKSEVVFVGTRYPERVRQLEYLVKNLSRPIDLKIYGANWNKLQNSTLSKCVQHKYLGPEEMRKAIYCSDISLGFLCKENRDDYTQRTFEIPATKGLLLAERTARHLTFYKEGEEAEFFDADNYDELVQKTEMLLTNKQKAASIRQKGFEKVTSSHHTYKDRLKRLLELYENSNKVVNYPVNKISNA